MWPVEDSFREDFFFSEGGRGHRISRDRSYKQAHRHGLGSETLKVETSRPACLACDRWRLGVCSRAVSRNSSGGCVRMAEKGNPRGSRGAFDSSCAKASFQPRDQAHGALVWNEILWNSDGEDMNSPLAWNSIESIGEGIRPEVFRPFFCCSLWCTCHFRVETRTLSSSCNNDSRGGWVDVCGVCIPPPLECVSECRLYRESRRVIILF